MVSISALLTSFAIAMLTGSAQAQSDSEPRALINIYADVPCSVPVGAQNNRNFWLPGQHTPFEPNDRNVGQCYSETFQGIGTNFFPTQANGQKCIFTAFDQANCNATAPGRAISFNDIDPTSINCKPGPFRAAPQLVGVSYRVTCP